MSRELKKPVVTKAGVIKPKTPKPMKGFFSRRNKSSLPRPTVKTKLKTSSKDTFATVVKSRVVNSGKLPPRAGKRKRLDGTTRLQLNKRSALISLTALVLLVAIFSITLGRGKELVGFTDSDSTSSDLLGTKDSDPEVAAPFATVNPGTEEGKLRAKFDSERGFYSFQEVVGSKTITVSQSAVPADFVLDVKTLLQTTEYSSATSLKTSKGDVYILVLEKSLLQQAFFKYNDSLVSIYATEGLPNEAWTSYIDSL